MQVALVTTFDLGRSHGLGDEAFTPQARNPHPDLGWVGIRNPLGNGTSIDLVTQAPQVLERWRQESVQQVTRPEMETGWAPGLAPTRADFDAHLAALVGAAPVLSCEVTAYAVGVAFLRLELGHDPADLDHLGGLLSCWEFAGYRPAVCEAVLAAVSEHLEDAVVSGRDEFGSLTERPGPRVQVSADGYDESTLIRSFTTVVECTSLADQGRLPDLLDRLDLGGREPIRFEYHGDLHFSWAACVLVPRGADAPALELARIWECIRIAHVFHSACQAFLALVEQETGSQVESYVGTTTARRGLADLNRLRTLTLAVVTLTNVERVTETEEDQRYLAEFARHAQLERTHQLLTDSVQVLYEVQSAEVQEERSRRESLLNGIVTVLALLTLVSVSADAYNFVREQESIVPTLAQRLQLLTGFVTTLVLLTVLVVLRARPQPPGARARRRRPPAPGARPSRSSAGR